jgi:hypothetical protein
MSRWQDASFQSDLRRLFQHVRKSRGQLPPQVGSTDELRKDIPYEFRAIQGASYLISGDDLPLLRSLQRRLAGRSRRDLGISVEEAGVLLRQACDEAVTGTIKGAVANLVRAVEAPISDYVVAEPVDILLPQEALRVGRVTYTSRIPRSVARRRTLELAQDRFRAPIAFTRLQARGWQTARILAAERFGESAAILDLIDRPKPDRVAGETMLVREVDGGGRFAFNRSPWMVNEGYIDDRGRLLPPFRQLSRAAAKAESARTDWERRVLAATRWHSRGIRSTWPADRLAANMVALECLFVAGIQERQKGALIAERASERFRLNEMTVDEQKDWLERLYRGRNAAVHEGREFTDDLDVDRLSELTRFIIRQLSLHLIAGHRYARHSCRTFDEAMRCGLRP